MERGCDGRWAGEKPLSDMTIMYDYGFYCTVWPPGYDLEQEVLWRDIPLFR